MGDRLQAWTAKHAWCLVASRVAFVKRAEALQAGDGEPTGDRVRTSAVWLNTAGP